MFNLPHTSLRKNVFLQMFCSSNFFALVSVIEKISLTFAYPHLVWSDPDDVTSWSTSPRGAGWLFGNNVTTEVRISSEAFSLMFSSGRGGGLSKSCCSFAVLFNRTPKIFWGYLIFLAEVALLELCMKLLSVEAMRKIYWSFETIVHYFHLLLSWVLHILKWKIRLGMFLIFDQIWYQIWKETPYN